MILDTNAIAALAANEKSLLESLRIQKKVMLPFVAVGEYRYGIRRSKHRQALEAWLEALDDKIGVLYADKQTLDCYAEIREELRANGTPIPANDIWIAALCRQHNAPIMSRDRHFDKVSGLKRLEW
jgi:predicted nucleic acid-binding protein